jgi:branched-chain amino acid transport system ATP-binding protein
MSDASSVALLRAADVTVEFGGVRALNSASLEVASGEIAGVIGPNGAGKTTLFAVLSGLLRPTGGTVWLGGEDVTGESAASRARAGLGRTFQQPRLFAGLSVREHLQLAYRMRNSRRRMWSDFVRGLLSAPADRSEDERCRALLSLLSIEQYADTSVLGLPLGVSRLVEVGRALAFSPSILLLDEPLAGLDGVTSDRVIERLASTAKSENIALVLIDHDFEAISQICEQITVIDFGTVIAVGPPKEVRNSPQVRAAYLGDLPPQSEETLRAE